MRLVPVWKAITPTALATKVPHGNHYSRPGAEGVQSGAELLNNSSLSVFREHAVFSFEAVNMVGVAPH